MAAQQQLVKLRCSLVVRNPWPRDSYQLLLFTTSPTSHPNSHEQLLTFDVGDRRAQDVAMQMRDHPNLMHAWLFVDTTEATIGLRRTQLIGCGSVEFASLLQASSAAVNFDLCDVESKIQAVVTLQVPSGSEFTALDRMRARSLKIEREGMTLLFRRIEQRIRGAYNRLRSEGYHPPEPDTSLFYYVRTHMQVRMPITTFAFLSTLVQRRGALDEALLEVLLEGATRDVRLIEAHSGGSYSHERRQGERLVAMCTTLTRALHYSDDTRRTGPTPDATTPTDQWTQLGTFPRLATTCFDCEDGAGLVLAVLYLVRSMDFRSPALREIQQFARRYTPFLALGNMRVGRGQDPSRDYVSHAYVVALDRRWAEQQINGGSNVDIDDLLPALSFEATSFSSGVWEKVDTNAGIALKGPIEKGFDGVYRDLQRAFADEPALYQCLRQFLPTRVVLKAEAFNGSSSSRHRGTYENQFVLMAPDHLGARVVHCIVTDDREGTIGALAERVLTYSPDVRLEVVLNQSRSDFENEYQCMWRQEPINRLPTATAVPASVAASKDGVVISGLVDIPLLVYHANRRAIEQALSRCSRSSIVQIMPPITTDGIGFARIYFA